MPRSTSTRLRLCAAWAFAALAACGTATDDGAPDTVTDTRDDIDDIAPREDTDTRDDIDDIAPREDTDTRDDIDDIDTLDTRDAEDTAALASPLPTDLATRDFTPTAVVRGVFFAPRDRPFAPGLRQTLDRWVRLAQTFFRDEMARWAPLEGRGRTFEFEVAPDGLWDVVFLVGAHDAAYYQSHPTSTDAPGEALAEIFAQLPPAAHRDVIIVYFYDTFAWSGGRALEHTGQAGSAAPWMGEHAGYALIGSHVLGAGFATVGRDEADQRARFEDTLDSGLDDWDGLGQWGPLTRGQWASTYLGASIHELGHAFGLEHVFGDEDGDGVENNLMGNGFRRFGARFTPALPRPATLLGPLSSAPLALHPFFR